MCTQWLLHSKALAMDHAGGVSSPPLSPATMTSSVADGYLGPVLIGNGLRQALLSTAVACQVYGHVVVVPLGGWGVGEEI